MYLINLIIVPFVAALPAITMRQANNIFSDSCTNIELVNAYPGKVLNDNLKGSCLGPQGKKLESSLDLNQCVGIDYSNNTLTWMPLGKFRNYCDTCSLKEGNVLACTCNRQASTLKLDDGVVIRDGSLSCK
ncbi:hypothetical protein MCOR27_007620 [Pyricularia oryzae]|uniref:Cyanovirin-N domain-containing protein n=1 Tax=Pyricularia grisea TaxID=148305 RepID=A0ABQ8NPK7_PYRGI|nr:hypothetical protein MCOR01_011443 [Pyricularia oryzae]KAI6300114.1 hypothetical protein MCOR33_004099 [Pyricularia grisea]KAI6262610.1 hypothetical protein MCOR19_001120 [Pyricularia oryzae]KAI6273975.1 hypothetical protein MCOR27_007620 [Pyricularia oryzae]KAI6278405.1 hypothetical protein MCOR26_004678 [Pyricularia oryzae]